MGQSLEYCCGSGVRLMDTVGHCGSVVVVGGEVGGVEVVGGVVVVV